jgi:hypothetical protein
MYPTRWILGLARPYVPIIVAHRATTSLGNVGAVFHPTTYLLNKDAILAAEARNTTFPFYIEGIARNVEVAKVIEEIDQSRLRLATGFSSSTLQIKTKPMRGIPPLTCCWQQNGKKAKAPSSSLGE